MNRANQILSVLLAVQLILAGVVFWPRAAPAQAEAEPLFGEIDVNDVVRLTLQDNNGNMVELARQNGAWTLLEADNYPANDEPIEALLKKVAEIHTGRLVTRTPGSHARLQVAENDFVRRLDLELDDGTRHTLFVGTASGARATHVRAGGRDEVYLASDLSSWEINTSASHWIDTIFFSVPQDDVVALTIENAHGTFEFERDEEDEWTMGGLATDEEFNPNNLRTLLTRLFSLDMTRPLGLEEKPEHGLDTPSALVVVVVEPEGEAAETHTLRIGARDPEDDTYAIASSESPYFVRTNSFRVEDFVNRTREDFIQPLQTVPDEEGVDPPEEGI